MNTVARLVVALVITLSALGISSNQGRADGMAQQTVAVLTKDGGKIAGHVFGGRPLEISIQTTGGTLNIKIWSIESIEFDEQDNITTKSGNIFKGTITTPFPKNLELINKAGQKVEIEWLKVKRVTFDIEDLSEEEVGPQKINLMGTIRTKGGLEETGAILGFPDTIQIKTDENTLTLSFGSIKELRWISTGCCDGESDTISTYDGNHLIGYITTPKPQQVQLEVGVGSLFIRTSDIDKITFQLTSDFESAKTSTKPPLPQPSLGMGL